jgi:hypothetical protein
MSKALYSGGKEKPRVSRRAIPSQLKSLKSFLVYETYVTALLCSDGGLSSDIEH